MFQEDDNRDFCLVQNFTIGEVDFKQFMRPSNQRVIAAECFGREENLSPVLIPTMSKDMDGKPRQAHEVVNVVNRPYRKICVTLLRYNADKPESSLSQVCLCARKSEDEMFHWIVFENYKVESFIYLPDLMNFPIDEVFTEQYFYYPMKSNCNYLLFIIFLSIQLKMSWNFGVRKNFFLKLKSKMGFYRVVLKKPTNSRKKLKLTLVEMRHSPDMGKIDAKDEISCLELTIYNSRKELCVN